MKDKVMTVIQYVLSRLWQIGIDPVFGAAVAAPKRRVVLITGEGSHQLTAQEISQFARHKLKPIVFVLNIRNVQ